MPSRKGTHRLFFRKSARYTRARVFVCASVLSGEPEEHLSNKLLVYLLCVFTMLHHQRLIIGASFRWSDYFCTVAPFNICRFVVFICRKVEFMKNFSKYNIDYVFFFFIFAPCLILSVFRCR